MSEEIKVQETAEAADQDLSNVVAYKKGDVVKGKIVKIEDNQAIVDIGYKYDGIIPLKELSNVSLDNAADAVQIGQELELKVLSLDDNKEKLLLSKRAVDSEQSWTELQAKLEAGTVIEAQVKEVVKGGLVVDVGLRGFVPASMVERHFVEDFSDYKGRTLRLKVKELDREKNKVVLSQKDVLDEEFEANKKKLMGELKVGQQLDGTVQRLTQFGAFVDIGGIDGLVHISEMAWHHVQQPSEVVQEGDKVQVQVLKVDPENDRISLSIRATQPGPWQQAADKFQPGEIVTGTVKRLVSFGAFVEIAPGVEGLVHISQIAHRHIGTPHEVLKDGQEVSVKILDFNPAEKRVSLSIKETEEAPEAQAKPERKPDRERGGSRGNNSSEPIPPRESLSMTLGERFGDKLSKFK
ncbi:30S ribosomal protein S1 [Paenibacillus mesophilus]|uniref:30S ribosomal protein S1 n=1 Tax=Paenibacillus mesophilus TaxID=2582849 RepID=UPI00110E2D03|nr:30S ribosomal protein S1 [Paenibacillus mesophilus]TMV51312.1 30S ribosomal protein S1 [Paenibacillus mesophilus]